MQRRVCGLPTQLERGWAGAGEWGYVLKQRGRHCFEFSTLSKEWIERGGHRALLCPFSAKATEFKTVSSTRKHLL